MSIWLLREDVLKEMQTAKPLTAEQRREAISIWDGFGADAGRVLEVSGDSATIKIVGVLTSEPDLWSIWTGRGNTLYGDILSAIAQVEADKNIKSVEFVFNTPGGQAVPLPPVGDAIYNMKKPTTAKVVVAASAGYWLASQVDKVMLVHRGAEVGSIGVVQSFWDPTQYPLIDVTSSNAPKKRPNPTTEEGLAAIREELDAFEELFITAVAVGRSVTAEKVISSFGQGGMLLADQAVKVGMADGVLDSSTSENSSKPAKGAIKMDLATLKADHPETFKAAFAEGEQAGQLKGAAAERDRVAFHLTMGTKNGCVDVAVKACTEGTLKDDGVTLANYLSAGANKRDLDSMASDEDELEGNTPNMSKEAAEDANLDAIFANVR